jgi:hypothetical protein
MLRTGKFIAIHFKMETKIKFVDEPKMANEIPADNPPVLGTSSTTISLTM